MVFLDVFFLYTSERVRCSGPKVNDSAIDTTAVILARLLNDLFMNFRKIKVDNTRLRDDTIQDVNK